jgi:hypothetical protein
MTDVLVKLCGMWQRERRGNTEGGFYLVGRLGAAKILGFKNHRKQSDDDPDWTFFVTEPTPRPGAPAREDDRGRVSGRGEPAARAGARRGDPGQHDTGDQSRPFDDECPF